MHRPTKATRIILPILALVAGGWIFDGLQHEPRRAQIAPSALRAVQALTSNNLGEIRAALAPEVASRLSSTSEIAPQGSRIRMVPDSWERRGASARVLALVDVPGRTPTKVRIYLVLNSGRWQVLFSESA